MTAPIDEVAGVVQRRLWAEGVGNRPLPERIDSMVADELPVHGATARRDAAAAVLALVSGLGPLQPLADDPAVTEIMVNAGREVWTERAGVVARADVVIEPEVVVELARRMAAQVGRRLDRVNPSVDARLADGARLHAIIPPLAVDGPCLTIRRFAPGAVELAELAGPATGLLRRAVRRSACIVVAGATSSGKTTLLNALGREIGADRVVTIEDAAELDLGADHVVRLETRPAGEGVAAVGMRELVRHALRMRPDRIICGEMRGAEALDLVQAMNTGHTGSMSTVHANGVADALRRIETMMLLGDAELPLAAIRDQLASCIDLVVHMGRAEGARRRVVEVAEVPSSFSGGWTPEPLFVNGVEAGSPTRRWAA